MNIDSKVIHMLLFVGLLFTAVFLELPILAQVITLIVMLYAFKFPKYAILLLIIYFPLRPFLIEFNPSLKGIGDAVIIFIFLRVLFDNRKQWRQLIKFNVFEWGFFLFCVVGSISAYLTGVGVTAIVFQLRAFLITYLLFFSIKHLSITKQDVRTFLWTSFYIAIIVCIHGLIEKLSLRNWLLPDTWLSLPLSETNKIRIYGMLGNPNVLAIYLTFVIFLSYYLKRQLEGKLVWLLNGGLILFLGVFIFTYSRGTWISVLLGLVTYLFLTKNWRMLRSFLVGIVLSVIVIYIPVNSAVSYIEETNFAVEREHEREKKRSDLGSRLSETFNDDTLDLSRNSGRLYFISKGLEVFRDHPIIGTGFGTFGDSATKSYSSPIYDEYEIKRDFYSDNQYIQIIVQTGSVGVLLFATFLLGMFFYTYKYRHKSLLAIVLISILVASYPAGLYYNLWENKTFTLYFFIMLGALASMSRKGEFLFNESSSSH